MLWRTYGCNVFDGDMTFYRNVITEGMFILLRKHVPEIITGSGVHLTNKYRGFGTSSANTENFSNKHPVDLPDMSATNYVEGCAGSAASRAVINKFSHKGDCDSLCLLNARILPKDQQTIRGRMQCGPSRNQMRSRAPCRARPRSRWVAPMHGARRSFVACAIWTRWAAAGIRGLAILQALELLA